MRVLYTPAMEEYLDELESILYEKGYYGTEELACKYVDDLTNDIEDNLPDKRHRPAPKYYDKYYKGMYYASFRKNRNTQWYPFFTKHERNGETIYIVRYIGNNHKEAHHLYEG
jgi:hypothetical protein